MSDNQSVIRSPRPIAALTETDRKALLDSVLEKVVSQDAKLKDIAAEIGVSRTGLNQALLKYCPEDWQSAQVARALVAVEDAEEELETASDILSVSRARERLRSAQWHLEKLNRRLFGENNQSNQGSAVQINIGIVRRPKESIGQDSDKSLTINVEPEQDV